MTKQCAACNSEFTAATGVEVFCPGCQEPPRRVNLVSALSATKPKRTEAVKFDSEKPRVDLFPPEALWAISTVLGDGATKYGARNWELGMDWSRIYAAATRHLTQFWNGEDIDPDGGRPHLWNLGCNVAFLISYELRGIGNDNRGQGITMADFMRKAAA